AQCAGAADIYARPADLTVARLTGPAAVLTAPARPAGAGLAVEIGDVRTTVRCDNTGAGGQALLVRPDWAGLGGELPGEVAAVRYQGPHTDHHISTPAGTVVVREPGPPRAGPGDRITWTLHRCWLLT
ncbi:MAG TPA: TOBE domain-containing protein, partial [Rugosimonospora sp.]|nr:TOBE domain-containing protein [Rugosimonospora sp.]